MTEHGDDLRRLAARATACRYWRWVPGMVAIGGMVYTGHYGPNVHDTEWMYAFSRDGAGVGLRAWAVARDMRPDVSHPATAGCLMALVREAWGAQAAIEVGAEMDHTLPDGSHHRQVRVRLHGDSERAWWGGSVGEALVMALEAAP